MTVENRVTIFAVDDHPVVAAGLKIALLLKPALLLIGTAVSPEDALPLISDAKPGVVVIDLVFEGKVRLDFIALCRDAAPEASIVVFSSLPAADHEAKACAAGADAYVSKERTLDDLISVIVDLSVKQGPHLGALQPDVPQLTKRELQIAELVSLGYSTAKISETLGINIKTAAAHCDNIRKKLKCADSRELIAQLAKNWSV